mgnify:CR=1 FL=1
MMNNTYFEKLSRQGFSTITSSLQRFVQNTYTLQFTTFFWCQSGEALITIDGYRFRFIQGSIAICPTGSNITVHDITSDFSTRFLLGFFNKLFNSFGIGDEDKNNGLLLLLALEEREFRVEVGDGLSGILPDGKTGRFQDDYIIPYLTVVLLYKYDRLLILLYLKRLYQ